MAPSNTFDTVIIGGGLSGLTAAFELIKRNPSLKIGVFEARNRFGGRVCNGEKTPHDLGGAWCWKGFNPNLEKLTNELNLEFFEQPGDRLPDIIDTPVGPQTYQYSNSDASKYRLNGGMYSIISSLVTKFNVNDNVILQKNFEVQRITHDMHTDKMFVNGVKDGDDVVLQSKNVVVAVPPRLASRFHFEPALPEARLTAMKNMNTWMSPTTKVAILFRTAFWRGKSINVFSEMGPLMQMFDASDAAYEFPAIGGFLFCNTVNEKTKTEFEVLLKEQIDRVFGGNKSKQIEKIEFVSWRAEKYTAHTMDLERGGGGHPRPNADLLKTEMNNKLIFASSETALQHCGLLDGAIEAGKRAAKQALQN